MTGGPGLQLERVEPVAQHGLGAAPIASTTAGGLGGDGRRLVRGIARAAAPR